MARKGEEGNIRSRKDCNNKVCKLFNSHESLDFDSGSECITCSVPSNDGRCRLESLWVAAYWTLGKLNT